MIFKIFGKVVLLVIPVALWGYFVLDMTSVYDDTFGGMIAMPAIIGPGVCWFLAVAKILHADKDEDKEERK